MATEVATLIAHLEAEVKRFDRDLKSAEKRLDSLDKTSKQTSKRTKESFQAVGSAAKIFIAGAAGAAMVKFGKDSVQAASNLNESLNAVEKTFGPVTDGINKLGRTAAERFGQSQREFNEFAVRFSAFGKNIARQSGQELIDVVDDMATRVSDFASVHNLSLEEAAQVAQSTLAGETEVFRRFGGDVSAATVKAKGEIMGLGSELSEQEKQLVRYQLFIEQTANTAGDFADTSDELANKQRILKARLEDAQAELGQAFLPLLVSLLEIGEPVVDFLGRFGQGLAEATGQISFAELALQRMETQTEGTRDSAEGFAFALSEVNRDASKWWMNAEHNNRNFVKGLDDIFDSTNITREELGRLNNQELAFFTEVLGLSEERAIAASDAIRYRFASSLTDAEQRARDAFNGMVDSANQGADGMEDPMGQIEDSADDAAGAIRAIRSAADSLRNINWSDVIEAMRLSEGAGGAGRIFEDPHRGRQSPGPRPVSRPPTTPGGIVANQGGGFLSAMQSSLVGEAGAEMFTPTQSGSVTPAHSVSLHQTFQRVEGENIESDIARGLILSGIGRFIETGF